MEAFSSKLKELLKFQKELTKTENQKLLILF